VDDPQFTQLPENRSFLPKTPYAPILDRANRISSKWQCSTAEGSCAGNTEKYTASAGIYKEWLYGEDRDSERDIKDTFARHIAAKFMVIEHIFEVLLIPRSTYRGYPTREPWDTFITSNARRRSNTYRTACAEERSIAACVEACWR